MVDLPPCRIWVVNYETKLGEYCPVVKVQFVYPYRKGHDRWNLKEPGLEASSANAPKDVIDVIVVGQKGSKLRIV